MVSEAPKAIEITYLDPEKSKYGYKSYMTYKENTFNVFEKKTQNINYSIGDFHCEMPFELKDVVSLLKRREAILGLKDDWDDQGSESFSLMTWEITAKFLLNYSKQIYNQFNSVIDIPNIYPSSKGSLDIDWETKAYGMIINVEKNGNKATYYADNKGSQMMEGVFNPLDFNINLLPRAIM